MTNNSAAKMKVLEDSNTHLLTAVRNGGDRWARTAMKSPDDARKALAKLGILTPGGKLTKKYK